VNTWYKLPASVLQATSVKAQQGVQGLGISSLDTIFKAVVLDKILYALSVYYGYLTEGQNGVLQRVLDRATTMIWMC